MSNSPPPAPPEKKPDPPAEWLMTFGDMMALLLTFFVLLIGIPSPDPGKFYQAIKSIADALGAALVSTETLMVAEKESEASFENLGSQVKEIINEGNMQDVVEVEVNEKDRPEHRGRRPFQVRRGQGDERHQAADPRSGADGEEASL